MPVYTQQVQNIFKIATHAARARENEKVYLVHLLCGIMSGGDSIARNILANNLVTIPKLEKIADSLPASKCPMPNDLPWCEVAEEITKIAPQEATALGHNYVGAEHLLLAMTSPNIGHKDAIIILMVAIFSLDLDKLRKEVLEILGHGEEKPFKENQQGWRFKKGDLCAWQTGNQVKPVLIESDVPMFDNTALVSEGVRVSVDSLLLLSQAGSQPVERSAHSLLELFQGEIILRLAGQIISLTSALKKTR